MTNTLSLVECNQVKTDRNQSKDCADNYAPHTLDSWTCNLPIHRSNAFEPLINTPLLRVSHHSPLL